MPEMRYTDVASYLKRLNFDYKIEFFSVPDSGTNIPINQNEMYVPFKITNTYTDKEVRFGAMILVHQTLVHLI